MLDVDDDLFTMPAGQGTSRVVEWHGQYYAVGARSSSGYREYKSDTDSYQNAVVSFVFVHLGEAVSATVTRRHAPTLRIGSRADHQAADVMELATFYIGGRWMGVRANAVLEAAGVGQVAKIPGAGATVAGVTMFHGRPIPVLAPAALFGTQRDASETQMVVMRTPRGPVGVMVDELGEMQEVAEDRIDTLRAIVDEDSFVDGVVRPAEGENWPMLLLVVDPARMCTRLLVHEGADVLAEESTAPRRPRRRRPPPASAPRNGRVHSSAAGGSTGHPPRPASRISRMATATLQAPPSQTTRLASVDVIRGAVMVLMAIDHVRVYAGVPAGGPDPAVFFTRWVTHFCAPAFLFLAGTSAFLYGRTHADVGRFLFTRGAWLVLLELTVLRVAWTFNLDFGAYNMAGVIWVIGCCMILMALLVRLPLTVVGAIGVIVIAGHNLLDLGTWSPTLGGSSLAGLWKILYLGFFAGPLTIGDGGPPLLVLYSIVPWIGVMAAGYAFGALLVRAPAAPHARVPDRRSRRDRALPRAARLQSLRRSAAVERAGRRRRTGDAGVSGVPEHHQVSGVAGVPADDARPDHRARSRWPSGREGRLARVAVTCSGACRSSSTSCTSRSSTCWRSAVSRPPHRRDRPVAVRQPPDGAAAGARRLRVEPAAALYRLGRRARAAVLRVALVRRAEGQAPRQRVVEVRVRRGPLLSHSPRTRV